MEILRKSLRGNSNLGLLLYATDKFCLAPNWLGEKDEEDIKKTLNVDVIKASVLGTDLLGVFCTGNSSILLVPDLIFDSELKTLKAVEKYGVAIHTFKTEKTALGNLIVSSDKGIAISPIFSKREKDELSRIFNAPVESIEIDDIEAIGSCIAINDERGVISPQADDSLIKKLENLLGVKIKRATVNFGQSYVSSGIVMNNYGFLIGQSSTGIELAEIDSFLRGIDD
ncbi:MAG: translation initiation factor 6 [Candidatus Woesearchaeota archaeon]|nr:translation initiation factor 6 [Candidatus Woesearchaeota archaeon]